MAKLHSTWWIAVRRSPTSPLDAISTLPGVIYSQWFNVIGSTALHLRPSGVLLGRCPSDLEFTARRSAGSGTDSFSRMKTTLFLITSAFRGVLLSTRSTNLIWHLTILTIARTKTNSNCKTRRSKSTMTCDYRQPVTRRGPATGVSEYTPVTRDEENTYISLVNPILLYILLVFNRLRDALWARFRSFYSAVHVLAMIDSVCLTVWSSVTRWSPCQNDSSYDHGVFTADSPMTLVSSWLT